jgi:hypothetical protein
MVERADSPQHTIDLQHYGNHQKSTELIAKLASEVLQSLRRASNGVATRSNFHILQIPFTAAEMHGLPKETMTIEVSIVRQRV